MMPDKPLLILPRSTPLPRVPRGNRVINHFRLPKREDQGQRIGPQLTTMLDAFVSNASTGTSMENILVLETIGRPENFRTAVAAVPGLKWLAEIDTDEIEADDRFFERPKIGKFFFKDRVSDFDAGNSREIVAALAANGIIGNDGFLREDVSADAISAVIPKDYRRYTEEIVRSIEEEKKAHLQGRMYLSLSNRQALADVKNLFDTWERNGRLRFGAGAWGEIFSHLRTVRFWNIKDRVTDTGILKYWQEEVECKTG